MASDLPETLRTYGSSSRTSGQPVTDFKACFFCRVEILRRFSSCRDLLSLCAAACSWAALFEPANHGARLAGGGATGSPARYSTGWLDVIDRGRGRRCCGSVDFSVYSSTSKAIRDATNRTFFF